MMSVTGVVLTGGRSRRMGTDKAFVMHRDRPMVIAVADALWEAGCHPVECQGGDLEQLAALGLPVVADDEPGRGPVAAMTSAARRHGGPIVVAACDLPFLDADTVRSVVDAGAAAGRPAVATTDERHHLLVYLTPGAFEHAPSGTSSPGVSLRDALDAAEAVPVTVDRAAVRNVNRPEDIADRREDAE